MMRGSALSVVVLRVPVLVAAILVLAGCATKSDIRDLQVELQAELRVLAERQAALITQLQTEANSTRDTLRGQSIQLFDFRGEISQQLRESACHSGYSRTGYESAERVSYRCFSPR